MPGRGHFTKPGPKLKSRTYANQKPRAAPLTYRNAGAKVKNEGSRLNKKAGRKG